MDPDAVLARARAQDVTRVVLVEGESDAGALRALAVRRGVDLAADGVLVVAMGGASAIGGYVCVLGPRGAGLDLAGLYDEAEIGYVRRALERSGRFPRYTGSRRELLADRPAREGLAAAGFHACVRDLEDELIRALGPQAVLAVIEQEGEAARFETFAAQPDHRGEPLADQLHRFFGTRSGRKIHYPPRLVAALLPGREPACLDAVLRPARDTGIIADRTYHRSGEDPS